MKVNYNTQKVFEALLNASENTNDWFSIDAASLIKEAEVGRMTFFRIMNKLESNGIIERKQISGKTSQYKILININCDTTLNDTTLNDTTLSDTTKNDTTLNDTTKSDTTKIKDDNNMKTMESLQMENNRLNERLNNCAAQFKQLIATVNELKSKVTELESKLNDLSTKDEKITADDENEDEDDDADNDEKLDLSNDNTSSEVTNQDNQENALEAKETALNEIEEEYKLFTDAVKLHKSRIGTPSKDDLQNYRTYIIEDCENKKIKIDVKQEILKKIDIYISRYNNFDISTSNMTDDTITPKEEEKPVERKETAPEKKQYYVYKRKEMTEAEMDAETERALDSIFGTTQK